MLDAEHMLAALPGWALFVLAAIWLFLEKGLPKLRAKPAHPSIPPTTAASPEELRALHAEVAANRELERRQLEILETLARSHERLAISVSKNDEAIGEIRATQKISAQTQEAIYRRLMENTGRFDVPRDR